MFKNTFIKSGSRSINPWLMAGASLFLAVAILVAGLALSQSLVAQAANEGLTVEIMAGYNLVVDSNVLSPSTYAPSVATVAGRFCNTSTDQTMTNVMGYIGNRTANTPGTYPSRQTDSGGAFDLQHQHLAGTPSYYAFKHVGGSLGTADATRLVGTLAPGECKVQYWHFSYPRRSNLAASNDNLGNQPVWGATNNPNDDLWLTFDIWGSGKIGGSTYTGNKSWKMTMRNEISAMANKIEPNPNGRWFNTDTSTVYPGDIITSNGVLYTLGNVNKGFDNDGDYAFDYNAWLQPVGDPSFDPSCFRLIRTTGVLTVTRSGGNPPLIMPLSDQLYFTNLPSDNTNVLGMVHYTFMALNGPCSLTLSPYQEAASGADNEKFNGDFGAGIEPVQSFAPQVTVDKSSNPNYVAKGGTYTYNIAFQNNGTADAGLTLTSGGIADLPLTVQDTVPISLSFKANTAGLAFTNCTGCTYTVYYSTNSGVTWQTDAGNNGPDADTFSSPTAQVMLRWVLNQPLPKKGSTTASAIATYQATVGAVYNGPVVVENEACMKFGDADPFACDSTITMVDGNYSISGYTWRDDDFGQTKNGTEPFLGSIDVKLYWDKDGDGVLDTSDVLIATQPTTAADPGYTFSNLGPTDYLVIVDSLDTSIPTGHNLTTAEVLSVEITNANITNQNFGFGPTLKLEKTRVTASPVNEGSLVTYNLKLTNTRPPSSGGFCTYTAWATAGTAVKNWTTPERSADGTAPNGTYAASVFSGVDDELRDGTFVFPSIPAGKITKVEGIFSLYLDGAVDAPTAGDDMTFSLYWAGAAVTGSATKLEGTALNAYGPSSSNQGWYTIDWTNVSGRTVFGGWSVSAITSASMTTDIIASKDGGKDTGLNGVYVDQVGIRITTDQPCGGSSEDIAVLPLTDTYNSSLLQYISANPTPDSTIPAGTLTWNNLGPLYGGQTKTVQVIFRALDPAASSTSTDNTGTVDSAKFGNGRDVNDVTSTASVTINQTGKIGDYVWYNPNGNSTKDTGEPGLANVLVELCPTSACATISQSTYTDSTGYYEFTVQNGTYYVRVTPPGSVTANYDSNGGNDSISAVTISGGVDNFNQDFGYNLTRIVYGQVWEDNNGTGSTPDAGENGFGGLTVYLCEETASPCANNRRAATTTTNSDGTYTFINPTVTNGTTYYLQIITGGLPGGATGWAQTVDPDATVNSQTPVTIQAGTASYGAYNFAYRRTPASSSIGNTVYADWNGNGTQNSGEPGLSGVTVYLYEDANGNGIVDPATDSLVAQQDTNASGQYLFQNLAANGATDRYLVIVDINDIPDSYVQTQDPSQTGTCTLCDNKNLVQLNGSNSNLDQDFGYQPRGSGVIGDRVWRDLDGDGTQDTAEPGIGSITVDLYVDINGNSTYDSGTDLLVKTTTTASDGSYSFTDLPLTTYFVRVSTTDTDLPKNSLGELAIPTTSTSQTVTLNTTTTSVDTADFGFTPAGVIGDRIWRDDDADGTQDDNEAGFSGVTVTLLKDADNNGSYETTVGTPITTNANGYYSFSSLLPGKYQVVVTTTSGPLSGLTQTYDPDSDPSSPPCNTSICGNTSFLTLTAGQANFSQDFGYRPLVSVGGRLWIDADNDGIQDAGENGINNVTVRLCTTATCAAPGDVVGTIKTDTDGYYSFSSGLSPSTTYYAVVTTGELPGGLIQSFERDTSTNNSNGVTTPANGAVTNVDFGYRYSGTATINGTVFYDASGTSEYHDPYAPGTDSPFANITVYLWRNGDIVGETTTNASGAYTFSGLADGTYTVSVNRSSQLLSGFNLTATPNLSCDPACTPTTAAANYTFALGAGATVSNVDFGFNGLVDFGDLPESYAGNTTGYLTRLRFSGPYHLTGDAYLGTAPDSETDGQPNNTATGDGADEDSDLTFAASYWAPGKTINLSTTIVDPDGQAYLVGWFDWNNDGDFGDDGEIVIFGNRTASSGGTLNSLALTIPTNAGYVAGQPVNMRFRLYDSQPLAVSSTGGARNGEVIDLQRLFASVGDQVWLDVDKDGVYDIGEPGLPNVTVRLCTDASCTTVLGTTTTDSNGRYRFTGLTPGTYYVDVLDASLPSGLAATVGNTDPRSVTLTAGEINTTTDFGYISAANAIIGDRVWRDVDGDGLQDPGESGLGGVTVELKNASTGATVATTTSAADGTYLFTNVPAGEYYVEVTAGVPGGYTLTGGGQGTVARTMPISVMGGDIYLNADFGYQNTSLYTITDHVWLDVDGDGTKDGGEAGLPGVSVALVQNFQVIAGRIDLNGDGFITEDDDGSLGGYTIIDGYVDLNGGGISDTDDGTAFGYTVIDGTLDINANGTKAEGGDAVSLGLVIGTTITAADGSFTFSSLAGNANYSLQVVDDARVLTDFNRTTTFATGGSRAVRLAAANLSNTSFGYRLPGLIGDTVFSDGNANGIQDPGEPGISGVTVTLWSDTNNDGIFDSTVDTQVGTTTTDASGAYLFSNNLPGRYFASVATAPGGYTATTTDQETGGNAAGVQIEVNLSISAPSNLDADFGYQNTGLADISGSVWNDLNINARDDGAGEPPFNGVTLALVDGSGNILATTTSAGDGSYTFSDVPAGSYRVVVTDRSSVLAGYQLTTGLDTIPVTVTGTTSVTGVDFGYVRTPTSASIGDFIWMDADRDGAQDAAEAGIAGVFVRLYATGPDGVTGGGDDTLVATTTTDANGRYLFENLTAGRYYVSPNTATLPLTGMTMTSGTTYPTGVIALSQGESFVNADFGYTASSGVFIGDRVWFDADGAGIQDPGEVGIGGVRITITGPGITGSLVTYTDADGSWLLPLPSTGDYTVTVTPPAGYNSTPTNGAATRVLLVEGGKDVLYADFGFRGGTTATIGDTVYLDSNRDGAQTAGEVGIPGVTVTLFSDLNANGKPDAFRVIDGRIDVNGDGFATEADDGTLNGYPIIDGYVDLNGGGVSETDDGTFYGYPVFDGMLDVNRNNTVNDSGDAGLIVETIGTTITDANGSYSFKGLPSGTYAVQVTDLNGVLTGLVQTDDPDNVLDELGATIVVSGSSVTSIGGSACTSCNNNIDFGYAPAGGLIGNLVFHDQNNNGIREASEPGLQGVTVNLYVDTDGNGTFTAGVDNLVRTTVTDRSGLYEFKGLAAGIYFVDVTDTYGVLAGMTKTTGTAHTDNHSQADPYTVTLATALSSSFVADFGYRPVTPYTLSGIVFEDKVYTNTSVNATFDSVADQRINAVQVLLYRDLDNDGRLDPGDPLIGTTVTNSQGQYSFTNLPAGNYIVVSMAGQSYLNGFLQTTQQYVVPEQGIQPVSITTADSTNNDFGFYAPGGAQTTPVTLSFFQVVRHGNGLHFEWSTDTETGNLGFNLYAVTSDGLQKLNAELIASPVVDSLERQDYSFDAADVTADTFYIEDLSVLGELKLRGPFNLGLPYGLRQDVDRIDWESIRLEMEARAAEREAVRRGNARQAVQDALGEAGLERGEAVTDALPGGANDKAPAPAAATVYPPLELRVARTGLYRVSYEALRDAGLDLTGLSNGTLALVNRGQPVPIRVWSTGKFGPGAWIEFYGEALDTLYTSTNVYYLYADKNLASRVTVDLNKAPTNVPIEPYYLETAKVERERAYSASSPNGDPWFDSSLSASTKPASGSFSISVDNYKVNAAPASLFVGLWGATDYPQDPDHHLVTAFNSQTVADHRFDGIVDFTYSVDLPAGLLKEGANELKLTLPADTGAAQDLLRLDRYSVTYPRAFIARDGLLSFTSAGKLFQVEGLPTANVVIYRLDGQGVSLVSKFNVSAANGAYRVRFGGTGQPATYWVTVVERLLQPAGMQPARPAEDLTGSQADYLIIAHPNFIAGLQPLVDARQAQGLSVKVVDVEAVYAQFGYGLFDPQGIQDYIRYAAQNMGTRYVLLVGGDTYDYRNYLGTGAVSFLPSIYAATSKLAAFTAVDALYADTDGNGLPDLAIGRFPVRKATDLDVIVAKTLAYANKDYGRSAVFSADKVDEKYAYTPISEGFISRMPADWSFQRSYLDKTDVATARSIINNAINGGVALTNYVGHSSTNVWTFNGLYSYTDVNALTNAGRPTVVVQWGCWNTYYTSSSYNTMAASFLLGGDRGAAAVLGATNLTEVASDEIFGNLLMPYLVQPGMSLGDALLAAKSTLAVERPELLDVLLGFTLLGDPALVIVP